MTSRATGGFGQAALSVPPGQGWPPPGQGWPPPGQPQWVAHRLPDVKPPMPGLVSGIRILVMVPTGIWLLGLLMLVLLGGAASDSVLGPVLTSFTLGLAAGDWAPMVLIPLAGCALTVTMGTGHRIDRVLFTALGVLWAIWFTWNIHFALTPAWVAIMLVISAVSCAWNPTYNQWVKAVEAYEQRLTGPDEGSGAGR